MDLFTNSSLGANNQEMPNPRGHGVNTSKLSYIGHNLRARNDRGCMLGTQWALDNFRSLGRDHRFPKNQFENDYEEQGHLDNKDTYGDTVDGICPPQPPA